MEPQSRLPHSQEESEELVFSFLPPSAQSRIPCPGMAPPMVNRGLLMLVSLGRSSQTWPGTHIPDDPRYFKLTIPVVTWGPSEERLFLCF